MKKCKKCKSDLPQADLFCSYCGATQEVVGKSKRWIGILFAVVLIGVVVALYFGKDYLFNKDREEVVHETPLNSNEAEVVEIEKKQSNVQPTNKTMPIEELTEMALYSTTVQSEKTEALLFVVPTEQDQIVTLGPEDDLAMGQQGDKIYTGEIDFYLAEKYGKEGYFQQRSEEEVTLNITQEPFQSYIIDRQTMIAVYAQEPPRDYNLSLFVFNKGQMVLVDTLSTSTTELKIIKDKYIQTYWHNFRGPLGWIFTTHEWKPKSNELSLIDTYELMIYDDMEDFEMYYEAYKEVVDEWYEYDYNYLAFPHTLLADNFVKELDKGRFLGEKIPLGESIEDFIKKNPNHLGINYYEGGTYYSYPSGELYFFDETIDEIIHFAYGGRSLKMTLSDFIELVGEPVEDTGTLSEDDPDRDYFTQNNHVMTFELGKYNLNVEYKDDEILIIWFYKQE